MDRLNKNHSSGEIVMNLFSISNVLADKTKSNFSTKKPVIASKVASAGVAYGVLGPTQSRTSFQVAEYILVRYLRLWT